MIVVNVKNPPERDRRYRYTPKVLAVKGNKELWFEHGRMVFRGRSEPFRYMECQYTFADFDVPHGYPDSHREKGFGHGRRLSKKFIEEHRAEIEAFLGDEITLFHLHCTICDEHFYSMKDWNKHFADVEHDSDMEYTRHQ